MHAPLRRTTLAALLLRLVLGAACFSSVLALADPPSPERQAAIERMQAPLQALADALDEPPPTTEGMHPLETYYPAELFPDLEAARRDYDQNLRAHVARYLHPRGDQFLRLLHEIWVASRTTPLAIGEEAGPPAIAQLPEDRSPSAPFATLQLGNFQFIAMPSPHFVDASIQIDIEADISVNPSPEFYAERRAFLALARDAVIHAIQNATDLEHAVKFMHGNIFNLCGLEHNDLKLLLVEATPTKLYEEQTATLLALLATEGEALWLTDLGPDAHIWHRRDLSSELLQARNLLLKKRDSLYAFEYLFSLLRYKYVTAPAPDAEHLSSQIRDFLADNISHTGPIGTRLGIIRLAAEAYLTKMIPTEAFIEDIFLPIARSVFQDMDSVWQPGYDPFRITTRQAIVRLELTSLLTSITWDGKLLVPAIQTQLQEFFLKLFYSAPTFSYWFNKPRDASRTSDYSLTIRAAAKHADFIEEVFARPFTVRIPPPLFKFLQNAHEKFQTFFSTRDEAGARAYLNEALKFQLEPAPEPPSEDDDCEDELMVPVLISSLGKIFPSSIT